MSRIGAKLWWLSSLLLAFAGGWLIWQSFIVPPPRSLQPDYVAAAGDVQITIDDIVVSGLTRPSRSLTRATAPGGSSSSSSPDASESSRTAPSSPPPS
jgi:hypothetical protein